MPTKQDRIKIEEEIVHQFNLIRSRKAKRTKLRLGSADSTHEFDIYEEGYVVGGITTSLWTNITGSANTGGKDRVSAELLWLTLWEGTEDRIMIMTDAEMAKKMFKIWHGCRFPKLITIIHYNLDAKNFTPIGVF